MYNLFKVIFIVFLFISPYANSAWFFGGNDKFIKAKDFNNGEIKGFNIGEIKDYDDRYINELSETGANVVRVIVPFNFCKPDNYNELKCIYNVSSENVDKLKKMNDQFKEKNIKIIVSAYFFEKNKGDFWKNKMLQSGMSDAWKYFADQIKEEDNIAALELYYAPDGSGMVNPYKATEVWSIAGYNMIKSIRSVDENHAIIFQLPAGDLNNLKSILPLDDDNIVYGVDLFYPVQITLQGLGENQQVLSYPLGAEFGLDPYNSGKVKVIDKQALEENIEALVDFKNKGNPVFITSWGIVHYAPQGSGYRYVKDMLDILSKNKISWAYYGFRINKALDPFIAGDTINDNARTPEAPLITLLKENMKMKK